MRILGLTAFLLMSTLASGPGSAAEMLPLEEVRPGMEGTGRTVFQGSRVEDFGVRILGVLDNAVGPRQSLILARLAGGPLAETGVIQGMSGSPVFIDGKLVGAVAYSFPFGKEPIAGITPIAEMIEATSVDTPRAASARFQPVLGPEGLPAPLDREAIAAAFERPLRQVVPGAFRGEPLPPGLSGAALTPLSLPLVFSGFDPSAFEWGRGLFSSLGFAPVLGAGASSSAAALGPLPDLEPGSAVGVSLIEGDLDLSATGTITHIDRDRVYAFGHPFYNLGPTRFPMKKAYVYDVFPSLQVSWKIAAAVDAVGTVDQDRATAIAGRLGDTPRMISTTVDLRSDHGSDRTFRFRLVEDELFTPILAYMSLLSVIQGHERNFGTATLQVEARVALADGREVRLRDTFATAAPASQAAALVAGPLTMLVTNRFEKVTVESVDVSITAEEVNRGATIVRAWLEHPARLRPGTTATLKVLLRTHRGVLESETLTLTIPHSAPPGVYDLVVADASTLNAVERREMRQPFAPRDLAQLVRALNTLRSGNRIYARLTRPAAGAIVGGEYLPALPSSVLSVMRSPDQGASVVPLATRAVWKGEVETEHAISGARRLKVSVER